MKLTKKQQEVVKQFQELSKEHDNKIVINARLGKAYFWKIDSENEIMTTVSRDPINQRVLNGLDEKGLIQPVDSSFNPLTSDEIQESKYNKNIKFVGAVINL